MVFKIYQVQTSRQDRPASLLRDDCTSGKKQPPAKALLNRVTVHDTAAVNPNTDKISTNDKGGFMICVKYTFSQIYHRPAEI